MSCLTMLIVIMTIMSQNYVVSSTPTLMNTICITGAGNYTTGGAYEKNLDNALTSLTTAATTINATFSNTTVGDGIDEVFALYYCTGGTKTDECSACVKAAVDEVVEKCGESKEVVIWYLECTLRYANRMIIGIEEEKPWAWLTSNKTVPDYNNLARVLPNTTVELAQEAAYNTTGNPPGYAGKEVVISSTETLLGLAQCAPGITGVSCLQCLTAALTDLNRCCYLLSYVNLIFLPSCRLFLYVQTSNSTSASPSPLPMISNSPEPSPMTSFSPPVFVSPPSVGSSSSSDSTNAAISPSKTVGSLGSDGKILKCRNNFVALMFLVIYLLASHCI